MIDCCLTPSEQYFSFNHEDFMELRNGTLNEFLIVIVYIKPPCNFIKLYEKNKTKNNMEVDSLSTNYVFFL
jgi:hypothetical protein